MKKFLSGVLLTGLVSSVYGITLENVSVTGVVETAAWIQLNLTNSAADSVVLYYGQANAGTNKSSWVSSLTETNQEIGEVGFHPTNLTSGVKYYYKGYAEVDTTNTVWADVGNFNTVATAPTSTVPFGYHSVMVNSNGTLILPTNFFSANGIETGSGYTNLIVRVEILETFQTNLEAQVTTITNDIANLQAATNDLNDKIDAIEVGTAVSYRYTARADAGEQVIVLASTTNIVVTRTNAVFNFSIPVSNTITSAKMRVDGSYTDGGKIYLDMGTNDMNNSSTETMWVPIATCFREDQRTNIPIIPLPSGTVAGRIIISGLGSTAGVIYSIRLGF